MVNVWLFLVGSLCFFKVVKGYFFFRIRGFCDVWPAKQSYLNDPDPQEIKGQQKKDISRKICAFGFEHFYIFYYIKETIFTRARHV